MISELLDEEIHFLEPKFYEVRKKDHFFLTQKISHYNFPVDQGCFLSFPNILKMFGITCLDESESIYEQCRPEKDDWLETKGFLLYGDEIEVKVSDIHSNRPNHVKGEVKSFIDDIYLVLPGKQLCSIEIKITKKSIQSKILEQKSFINNQDIIQAQKEFKNRIYFFHDRLKIFFPKMSLFEIERECRNLINQIDFNMVQFETFEAKRFFFVQLCRNSTIYSWDWILKHSTQFDQKVKEIIIKNEHFK